MVDHGGDKKTDTSVNAIDNQPNPNLSDKKTDTSAADNKHLKKGGYRAEAGGSLRIPRNRHKNSRARVDVRDVFKDQAQQE